MADFLHWPEETAGVSTRNAHTILVALELLLQAQVTACPEGTTSLCQIPLDGVLCLCAEVKVTLPHFLLCEVHGFEVDP